MFVNFHKFFFYFLFLSIGKDQRELDDGKERDRNSEASFREYFLPNSTSYLCRSRTANKHCQYHQSHHVFYGCVFSGPVHDSLLMCFLSWSRWTAGQLPKAENCLTLEITKSRLVHVLYHSWALTTSVNGRPTTFANTSTQNSKFYSPISSFYDSSTKKLWKSTLRAETTHTVLGLA